MIEVLKQMVEALECALSEDKPYIDECKQAIQAGKQAIAELESQESVAGFYLPIRKDMREDVEALIDHAKRARWTNVVVRKDAVETTYEADWIKELIPYTPPQRTWVGLTEKEQFECMETRYEYGMSEDDIPRIIEAKLKEKNT